MTPLEDHQAASCRQQFREQRQVQRPEPAASAAAAPLAAVLALSALWSSRLRSCCAPGSGGPASPSAPEALDLLRRLGAPSCSSVLPVAFLTAPAPSRQTRAAWTEFAVEFGILLWRTRAVRANCEVEVGAEFRQTWAVWTEFVVDVGEEFAPIWAVWGDYVEGKSGKPERRGQTLQRDRRLLGASQGTMDRLRSES